MTNRKAAASAGLTLALAVALIAAGPSPARADEPDKPDARDILRQLRRQHVLRLSDGKASYSTRFQFTVDVKSGDDPVTTFLCASRAGKSLMVARLEGHPVLVFSPRQLMALDIKNPGQLLLSGKFCWKLRVGLDLTDPREPYSVSHVATSNNSEPPVIFDLEGLVSKLLLSHQPATWDSQARRLTFKSTDGNDTFILVLAETPGPDRFPIQRLDCRNGGGHLVVHDIRVGKAPMIDIGQFDPNRALRLEVPWEIGKQPWAFAQRPTPKQWRDGKQWAQFIKATARIETLLDLPEVSARPAPPPNKDEKEQAPRIDPAAQEWLNELLDKQVLRLSTAGETLARRFSFRGEFNWPFGDRPAPGDARWIALVQVDQDRHASLMLADRKGRPFFLAGPWGTVCLDADRPGGLITLNRKYAAAMFHQNFTDRMLILQAGADYRGWATVDFGAVLDRSRVKGESMQFGPGGTSILLGRPPIIELELPLQTDRGGTFPVRSFNYANRIRVRDIAIGDNAPGWLCRITPERIAKLSLPIRRPQVGRDEESQLGRFGGLGDLAKFYYHFITGGLDKSPEARAASEKLRSLIPDGVKIEPDWSWTRRLKIGDTATQPDG